MTSRSLPSPSPWHPRLADLVEHLTSCGSSDAQWAISQALHTEPVKDDPLGTVAHAMVLLRHRGTAVAGSASS